MHGSEAIRRKEAGQQLSLINAGESWRLEAMAALREFIHRRRCEGTAHEFTFDEFREWALCKGFLSEPDSINAWGSLPRVAKSLGIIKSTTSVTAARRASSHARLVRVWSAA